MDKQQCQHQDLMVQSRLHLVCSLHPPVFLYQMSSCSTQLQRNLTMASQQHQQ